MRTVHNIFKGLIILILTCNYTFSQITATLESFGGVPNSMGSNNTTAWANAISAHNAGNLDVLVLQGGSYYNFDTQITLNGVDGLTIQSSNTSRATILSDNLVTILKNTSNSSNVTINYIKFESTFSDGDNGQGNNNALFYPSESATNTINYVVNNCEFTAPNANTNGIKVYVQNGELFDGLTVTNSYFHDLGRMGCETVNHDLPKPVSRIVNIIFNDNIIENVGLSPISHGMGVSLSGRNEFIQINRNSFLNCNNTGIELIGVKDGDVTYNSHSGLGSPVHIVNGNSVTNEDLRIENNESSINQEEGLVIIQATGLAFKDNIYRSLNRHYWNGLSNSTFTNDYLSSSNIAVVQFPTSTNAITNANVTMTNCRLEKNSGQMLQVATSGSLSLNCTELYNTTSNFTESNVTYTNVGNYLNNSLVGSQGGNVGNCSNPFTFVGNSGGPTTSCSNDISNEYSSIVLSSSSLVSGLDNVLGTSTNVNSSACAIELHNTNSNEPFSRIEKSINLASNSLLAGDILEIRLDANNNTGLARLELVQDNTPNTSLSSNTYTGSGWQTYVDTIVIPSGIITLDLWLYSNYNTNTPGVTFYDNLYVRKIDTTNCPDYLPNEDLVITLPQGVLSSGLDSVNGTSLITNVSSCALEVENIDNNQLFSRYHIPVVLANYGLNAGDLIEFMVDGNNHTGAARVEIVTDNTPNTAVSFYSFVGSGWDSFSDTFTIPSGITSLDLWFFSNYNTAIPGTAVYDNLVLRKLNTTEVEKNTLNELTIYPNPTTDNVFITSEALLTKVEFYNSLGELVLTKQTNSKQVTISLANLPKGIYSVKSYSQLNTLTKQLIKL